MNTSKPALVLAAIVLAGMTPQLRGSTVEQRVTFSVIGYSEGAGYTNKATTIYPLVKVKITEKDIIQAIGQEAVPRQYFSPSAQLWRSATGSIIVKDAGRRWVVDDWFPIWDAADTSVIAMRETVTTSNIGTKTTTTGTEYESARWKITVEVISIGEIIVDLRGLNTITFTEVTTAEDYYLLARHSAPVSGSGTVGTDSFLVTGKISETPKLTR